MIKTILSAAIAVAFILPFAAATASTTLDFHGGAGFDEKVENTVSAPEFGVGLTYKADTGFLLGMSLDVAQKDNAPYDLEVLTEGQFGYSFNVAAFRFGAIGGAGFRQASENDRLGAASDGHLYYVGIVFADVKIAERVTFNAIEYRYRDAFDTDRYAFNSQRVSTGLTLNLTPGHALYGKVGHTFEKNDAGESDNHVTVGYRVSF